MRRCGGGPGTSTRGWRGSGDLRTSPGSIISIITIVIIIIIFIVNIIIIIIIIIAAITRFTRLVLGKKSLPYSGHNLEETGEKCVSRMQNFH